MDDGYEYWQSLAIELIKLATSALIVFGAWMKNKERGNGPQDRPPTKRSPNTPKALKRPRSRGR